MYHVSTWRCYLTGTQLEADARCYSTILRVTLIVITVIQVCPKLAQARATIWKRFIRITVLTTTPTRAAAVPATTSGFGVVFWVVARSRC